MKIIVGELLELLEGLDEEMEVRLAMQPAWAMEYSIDRVAVVDNVVYLSEGEHIGYLSGEVSQELGWK